ncbi:hypothetical protein H6761_03370 [Candidatus Nomurabacteria bacterium]|nr:hypothetical protein [Candidatus Nomurabacteria bacterium]
MIIIWFLIAFIGYLLAIFLFAYFLIPHFGFRKISVPNDIPESMEDKINELKNSAGSPEEFLDLTYDYLGNKYHSERWNTLLKPQLWFKNLEQIWQIDGFVPCHQSSFIFKIFLVRSDFFKQEDIKIKLTFLNFVIHHYLLLSLNGKQIPIDVGEKQNGLKIGEHANFFAK